jgi:hypothetical protein
MKSVVLLKDGKKYCGKYVAMESFTKRHVIAAGKQPKAVLRGAKKKGFAHPVLFYVPQKNTHNIY